MVDKKEIQKALEELATPIDFDALVLDGVLEKKSKKKYKLLKPDALPAYAFRQARGLESSGETIILEFEDSTKAAQKLLDKMK